MKLYRVENLVTNKGLWYNTDDQKKTDLVHDLNLTARILPMEYTSELANDKWKSAADSIEQLHYWFSHEDLEKLLPLGFNLYEIDTEIFKYHEMPEYTHPLFQEVGVLNRKVLDIDLLLNG